MKAKNAPQDIEMAPRPFQQPQQAIAEAPPPQAQPIPQQSPSQQPPPPQSPKPSAPVPIAIADPQPQKLQSAKGAKMPPPNATHKAHSSPALNPRWKP